MLAIAEFYIDKNNVANTLAACIVVIKIRQHYILMLSKCG